MYHNDIYMTAIIY